MSVSTVFMSNGNVPKSTEDPEKKKMEKMQCSSIYHKLSFKVFWSILSPAFVIEIYLSFMEIVHVLFDWEVAPLRVVIRAYN